MSSKRKKEVCNLNDTDRKLLSGYIIKKKLKKLKKAKQEFMKNYVNFS